MNKPGAAVLTRFPACSGSLSTVLDNVPKHNIEAATSTISSTVSGMFTTCKNNIPDTAVK